MTYRTHFPDFPPETMPAIPPHWVDVSWGPENCPSFEVIPGFIVWVDYADPSQREYPDTKRFTVADVSDINNHRTLIETDDWEAVVEAVDEFIAEGIDSEADRCRG